MMVLYNPKARGKSVSTEGRIRTMSKSIDKQVSRRRFLRQAAATVAGVVAAPYVITSTALGAESRPPSGA